MHIPTQWPGRLTRSTAIACATAVTPEPETRSASEQVIWISARTLRVALFATLAVVLVAVTAGCSQTAKPSSRTASSSPPAPTATPVSPGSPLPSTAPAQPAAAPGPSRCSTADLLATVGAINGAAGTGFYPLDFTNLSGSACTMYGYPGVAFITDPGSGQIGAAAGRTAGSPALIILKPGATAHATLGVSDVLVSNNCPHRVWVNWVQVYPPDQYRPLFARIGALGCADPSLVIMGVSPVSSGP